MLVAVENGSMRREYIRSIRRIRVEPFVVDARLPLPTRARSADSHLTGVVRGVIMAEACERVD